MSKNAPDVMGKARRLFEKSGLSLDELGQRMGYVGDVSRKSAWQFLHRTVDPRLSMLKKFSEALNISLVDLVK